MNIVSSVSNPMNTPNSNELADMNSDMSNMPHSKDHGALEKLIEAATPTHIAAKSGNWSDPGTWKNGKVPAARATVLIENGKTVTYDQVSDARIKTILVEGNLQFATGKDTQLYVETILNAPEGQLNIGSEGQAIAAD